MSERAENEWVQCGTELAKLEPTCDLRWWVPATPGEAKRLQQRWAASAKQQDGCVWEEERWRDVPTVQAPRPDGWPKLNQQFPQTEG